MNLSNTLIKARLTSGNLAVYEVQPQHLNLLHYTGMTLGEVARMYGRQVAHELNGQWCRVGFWAPLEDPKLLKLIDQMAEA